MSSCSRATITLGLADQPEVVEAGKKGLDRYGAGTASVRFICGTFDIHRVLEERIAAFLGTQASLSYVSCWNANTGLFPTICDERSAIVSDELNHASIIDGVRLASKARRERFKHGNMRDLEEKLESVQGCFPIVVVTDGVFSMEGDLAKLPDIVALAKRYGAIVVVDDSHGTGVMGSTGRGTVEHYGLTGEVDVITGTLGKALGGAAGGFVAGSHALIDTLTQRSRPQLFSNALPATVACSSLAAIEYLDSHPNLVQRLRENTRYFRERPRTDRLQAARERERNRADHRRRNGVCDRNQRQAAECRRLCNGLRVPGRARRNGADPRADQRSAHAG